MSAAIETDRFGIKKFGPRGRDFETWERGEEHIAQEGNSAWQEIRERHGLSREDLESLSEDVSFVCWEEWTMLEDRPGLPTLDQLVVLALLEGTSPGALLDRVLIAKGEELEASDRGTG